MFILLHNFIGFKDTNDPVMFQIFQFKCSKYSNIMFQILTNIQKIAPSGKELLLKLTNCINQQWSLLSSKLNCQLPTANCQLSHFPPKLAS